MVKVKICGITSWRDAQLAVDGGAHALGFNFYRRSPRYVLPGEAARIVMRLPAGVIATGVFVNESPADIARMSRAVELDLLQLHGEESPEEVAELAGVLPVVKAFRVGRRFHLADLRVFRFADAFLLDGFDARRKGGTGRRFDWGLARRAARYGRIFLAGGLTPENVAEAIRAARPDYVDVCSGVEARPGRKDPRRLRELMRRVEEANRELR